MLESTNEYIAVQICSYMEKLVEVRQKEHELERDKKILKKYKNWLIEEGIKFDENGFPILKGGSNENS